MISGVPLEILATFKRVAMITTDTSLIASALRESQLLMLSSDSNAVRRVSPLPPRSEYDSRSVLCVCLHTSTSSHA